jgi:hypothetical protein
MPKAKLVFWLIAGSMEGVGSKLWVPLIYTCLEITLLQYFVRRKCGAPEKYEPLTPLYRRL